MAVSAAIATVVIAGVAYSKKEAKKVNAANAAAAASAKKAQEKALAEARRSQQESEELYRKSQTDTTSMAETASVDYGVSESKTGKTMTSEDLLIPSSIEQNLGGIKNKTGLGF